MTIAVVAEKPAVARDLARVLGARQRGDGVITGNGYAVTWTIGHLVALAEPQEIDPAWQRWRRDALPMLPRRWPLVVSDATRSQFEAVRRVINAADVEQVVCATDAGREGELIFRYVYQAAGCTKPIRRLWISSLTDAAIRRGFAELRDGRDFEPLAAAARGRSQADWLVGMNLTRAVTLAYGRDGEGPLSVGRVQTPTLALLAERELAISAFVPEDYLEVVATFAPADGDGAGAGGGTYRGVYFRGARPSAENRRLTADGEEAAAIVERALAGRAEVASVTSRQRRLPPPLLYDLAELQRHANRLYGLSAQQTLDVLQRLYERHKLISYPRTDSRHLPRSVAGELGEIVAAVAEPYRPLLAPGTGSRPLGRRFVDDARVTDHHAIIPTTTRAEGRRLSRDERRLYDLVCRRLLAAWHDDHVWRVTHVITTITGDDGGGGVTDRYHSTGTQVLAEGWKVLDVGGSARPVEGRRERDRRHEDGVTAQDLPADLARGQRRQVRDARPVAKRTRPPRRFTEATLLSAMETAGEALDDRALSAAMKERGLGTPATRAAIIETLLKRRYAVRQGKSLAATDKGIELIERVHPQVKSPAMTGTWEQKLKRIERGEEALDPFMAEIEAFVRRVVREIFEPNGERIDDEEKRRVSPKPPAEPSPR
ncbi:MAG: DNA topoisomerase III, partial [Acidobacteria bacterium]